MYVSINGWLYQCGTGATGNTGAVVIWKGLVPGCLTAQWLGFR